MEPITREEHLMAGDYIEPVTREEKILAGEDIDTATRREWFLKEYRNSGGGDIEVVSLSATENKTYTAPEGKAYSPVNVNVPEKQLIGLYANENKTYIPESGFDGFSEVTVDVPTPPPVLGTLTAVYNGHFTPPSGVAGFSEVDVDVPLPQNAYLLKSASGSVVSFSDGSDLPMPSLTASITAIQDLHGYDSPWVGGAGRNLFYVDSRVPTTTISDVGYSSDDEYIYLNGTKQGGGYADLSSASITLDSGTYYIKAFVISGTASNTVELYPYDGSSNLTSSIINTERTLTLSESKTFRFRFAIWTDGTVLSNYKVGIVVSKTSSIDKFYPYSNECPITGFSGVNVVRDGKNLLNETSEAFDVESSNYLQQLIPVKTDSVINISITDKDTSVDISGAYLGAFVAEGDSTQGYSWIVANGATQSSSLVITGKRYITVYPKNKLDAILARFNIQVEFGSEATTYTPYNGNTYSLTFTDGTNPLIVYGGYVDLVSGVLTVNRCYEEFDGSNDEQWAKLGSSSASAYAMRILLQNNVDYPLVTEKPDIMNNYLPIIPQNATWGNYDVFATLYAQNSNSMITGIRTITTVEDWRSYLTSNPLQVAYKLATPLSYQLSKQQIKSLVGENNVFADTGNVSVTYLGKEVS